MPDRDTRIGRWSNRLFGASGVFAVVSVFLGGILYHNAGSSKTDSMMGILGLFALLALVGAVVSLVFVRPLWKKSLAVSLFILSALGCAVMLVLALAMVGG